MSSGVQRTGGPGLRREQEHAHEAYDGTCFICFDSLTQCYRRLGNCKSSEGRPRRGSPRVP
jgi:hypothetical protein